MFFYTLHYYKPSIDITMLKEMSMGFYSSEFHPKRKKLKYWQKKHK